MRLNYNQYLLVGLLGLLPVVFADLWCGESYTMRCSNNQYNCYNKTTGEGRSCFNPSLDYCIWFGIQNGWNCPMKCSVVGSCEPCSVGRVGYQCQTECPVGTYAKAGFEECAPCLPGTFSNTTRSGSCTACPKNAVSELGSSSCVCDVGYEFKSGACTQCQNGTFKSLSGNTDCVSCGLNSISSPGFVSCICAPGFVPSADSCVPCAPGSFKQLASNSSCASCSANEWSGSGATSCQRCGRGATNTPSFSSCHCDVGYTNSGDSCIPCASNTYKSVAGNATCTACVANASNQGKLGSSAASECVCNAGFEGSGSTSCNACSINFSKAAVGNAACTACGVNAVTQGQTGSLTCFCPPNTYGDPSTGCSPCPVSTSKLGYTSSITVSSDCTASPECPKGKYGNPSTASCTDCPDGTFKSSSSLDITTAASHCLACATGFATIASGSSSCQICASGFEPRNGTCLPCNGGFFKANKGNSSCIQCAANQWSNSGATVCTSCGTNANSIAGSPSCTCDAGYTMSGNACVQCSAGTFKPSSGNGTCTQCVANSYSVTLGATSNNTCIPCFAKNTASSPGSTTCSCKIGYEMSNGVCEPCALGAAKDFIGNSGCLWCDVNEYSANGGTTCRPCGANTVSTAGSTSCVCAAGYAPDGNACSPCRMGTFKSAAGNSSCTLCAANTFSDVLGATSISTCAPCRSNSASLSGSAYCFCVAGYGINGSNGSSCDACPTGTYQLGGSNSSCIPCQLAPHHNSTTTCSPLFSLIGSLNVSYNGLLSSAYYKNNALWAFAEHDYDNLMIRHNITSNSTDIISELNDDNATISGDEKPLSRSRFATAFDDNGNMYLYGGYKYKDWSFAFMGDLWVFNVSSSRWKFIYGPKDQVMGNHEENTLESRVDAMIWIDRSDNHVYVFNGYSRQYDLQSVWRVNVFGETPAVAQYVTGSNITVDYEIDPFPGQPGPCNIYGCDSAPTTGAYCYGGWTTFDLWRFDPTSPQPWQLLYDKTSAYGPRMFFNEYQNVLLVNKVLGHVYLVLGVDDSNTVTPDIWIYSISLGSWSKLTLPDDVPRRMKFGAAIDEQNNLYLFGGNTEAWGGTELSDVRKIPFSLCVSGEFRNNSVCSPCPAGFYSSGFNVSSCTPCPSETSSDAAIASLCKSQAPSYFLGDTFTPGVKPHRVEGHSVALDKQGDGLWIFGGASSNKKFWRYNTTLNTFSLVTDPPGTNQSSIPIQRTRHASWVDRNGNLFIFGGLGRNADTPLPNMDGAMSDLWVYNVSLSQWRLLSGSDIPYRFLNGTLGPRIAAGHWTDVMDGCLYIFGGYSYIYNYYQSVWKFDPSGANTVWQYVAGSNTSTDYGSFAITNEPTHRFGVSCDASPIAGAFCFGGKTFNNLILDDFWRFNPNLPLQRWQLIQSQSLSPPKKYSHRLLVNKALGKVFVLFGYNSQEQVTSDIWSYSLASQTWTEIISPQGFIGRAWFGATIDNRNMIYVFGGQNPIHGDDDGRLNDMSVLSCFPGEFNSNGVCLSCPTGTYSTTYNVTSCTLCPEDTYSPSANAISSNACLSCPSSLGAVPGSTSCGCKAGQTNNGTSCVNCPINTYKASSGNFSCTPCVANSFTNGLTGAAICHCNIGYYGNGLNSCTVCPGNTYKTTIGNAASCTSCIANSGTNGASGSTNANACLCNAGFNGTYLTSCSPCSAGTFKSSIGNASCMPCLPGTFQSETGRASCSSCLPGSFQNDSGRASCIQCPIGTFQNSSGQLSCNVCSQNSFAALLGSASCTPCVANAVRSSSGGDCLCSAGFYGNGATSCSECPLDTYKSAAGNGGNAICLACDTGFSTNGETGASSCNFCASGYRKDSSDNLCIPTTGSPNTTASATIFGLSRDIFIAIVGAVGGVLMAGVAAVLVHRQYARRKAAQRKQKSLFLAQPYPMDRPMMVFPNGGASTVFSNNGTNMLIPNNGTNMLVPNTSAGMRTNLFYGAPTVGGTVLGQSISGSQPNSYLQPVGMNTSQIYSVYANLMNFNATATTPVSNAGNWNLATQYSGQSPNTRNPSMIPYSNN